MFSKESNMIHGIFLIAVGALLMTNPFGLIAFINFIIGALIIGSGIVSLVPVIQLPIPFKQKAVMSMGGMGIILLGVFVSGNPKFLLAVISFSFLLKSINGLINAFKTQAYSYYKKSMIINGIINLIFAGFIFFNIGTAVSSVIFIIGIFLVVSGGVDVVQAITSNKKVSY